MTLVLPSLIDRWRKHKNGQTKYTGRVLLFEGSKKSVIAVVYGETAEEMWARKSAVWEALKLLEEKASN